MAVNLPADFKHTDIKSSKHTKHVHSPPTHTIDSAAKFALLCLYGWYKATVSHLA